MSLNITVASPRLVLCVSDRRLVNVNTGKIVTERSTKLTVLYCKNALALITYNGVGEYEGKTPADWLLELDDRVELTALPFKDVLQAIKGEASSRLAKVPASSAKRHTFVLGAWGKGHTWICMISNYEEACSEKTYDKAQNEFQITGLPESPGAETRVVVTGAVEYVDREDCEKVVRVAKRAGAAGVDIKNLCIKAVKNAAKQRKGRGPVGSSVLWGVAEKYQGIEWGLGVQSGTRIVEAPNFIAPGWKTSDMRIEVSRGDSVSWGKPFPLPEAPCPACRNPVPLGYEFCGVCGMRIDE